LPAVIVESLEPSAVWRHFDTLCRIPRPSKHERALREHLAGWAAARGFGTEVDGAGNLLIRKPATSGMEDRLAVALQGHLDMVCQKQPALAHDFHRDPIRPVLRDGWLTAEQTTLGADNGIGVALALAVLESDAIRHGPLEVLLTVDEEAGMGGARNLQAGCLDARLLINLDTEEWGRFYVGCAGGMDVTAERDYAQTPLQEALAIARISVAGLVGGHSGIDIHRGRGHAVALLVDALRRLGRELPFRLVGLEGGTARNAIPRDAFADVAVDSIAALRGWIDAHDERTRAALATTDPAVRLGVAPSPLHPRAAAEDGARLLETLAAVPQGVRRMSDDFAGVVETSNNLGVVRIGAGRAEAVCMVRSLVDADAGSLARQIAAGFAAGGWTARTVGAYPGWRPAAKSPWLALCRRVYRREFGAEAGIEVIHAGLECGLIGARYPAMDMISFGPDIQGAHAPGERVNVASVAQVWRLLAALLAEIPRAG